MLVKIQMQSLSKVAAATEIPLAMNYVLVLRSEAAAAMLVMLAIEQGLVVSLAKTRVGARDAVVTSRVGA